LPGLKVAVLLLADVLDETVLLLLLAGGAATSVPLVGGNLQHKYVEEAITLFWN
jgi:hypothetical protein